MPTEARYRARQGWGLNVAFDQKLEGMKILGADGTKVGKVVQVDKVLGYFETFGTFSGPRYIPFFAFERMDQRRSSRIRQSEISRSSSARV